MSKHSVYLLVSFRLNFGTPRVAFVLDVLCEILVVLIADLTIRVQGIWLRLWDLLTVSSLNVFVIL